MAKSIINNVVGDFRQTVTVPATSTVAATFAENILVGFWTVYEETTTEGNDVVTHANDVNVMVKNTAGVKTYLSFIADAVRDTHEIQQALKGLNINGVLADEVYILGFKRVDFA